MTSFARTAGLLLVATVLVPTAPASPGVAADRAVVTKVAERWSVSADAVRIEWSSVPSDLMNLVPSRVLGSGRGGWLVAVFTFDDAPAQSVRFRAGVFDTLLVATRPLEAGTVLATDDVRAEPRVTWGVPRAQGRSPQPGWDVMRHITSGSVIAEPFVLPARWVEAGAPVQLRWRRGAVTVVLDGTAVSAARAGEPVSVRLPGHRRPVAALAVAPGLAELTPQGVLQ